MIILNGSWGLMENKQKEAEYIFAKCLLDDLKPTDWTKNSWERLKDTYLQSKVSYETWERYVKEEIETKEELKLSPEEEPINLIWDKELAEYNIEEKEWLIEGLIPAGGIGVWTGKRGTYKTFLLMNAAYCIASGCDFLNKYKTKKGKIIYLDKENGIPIMKERSRMIKTGLGLDKADIGYICFSQLKIDKNMDIWKIEELIKEHKPAMLVIDTYRRAISFDENSAGDVSRLFVDILRPIVDKHWPLSIVLIHHDRKGGGQDDEMDEIRGSSDLANYCDFILKNQRKGKNIILKQLKNRNAAEVEPIGINVETDEIKFMKFTAGESKVMSYDEKCSEILLVWLAEHKIKQFNTKEAKEVAFSVGIKKNNFFNGLALLENQGIIEKTGHGLYDVISKEAQEDLV